MASVLTLSLCLDAGHVRLVELGRALRQARTREDVREVERLVSTILHLRLSLEEAARLRLASPEQAALLGYLCETYGLRHALVDPLLRPLLPVIPIGSTLRHKVLEVNGKLLLVNGKLLIMRTYLSTALPPETP